MTTHRFVKVFREITTLCISCCSTVGGVFNILVIFQVRILRKILRMIDFEDSIHLFREVCYLFNDTHSRPCFN